MSIPSQKEITLGFRATTTKSIALDFDGVVHSYRNGWEGITSIRDRPVEGAREAISMLRYKGYKILIYSTRCSTPQGKQAIRDWLKKNHIKVDGLSTEKPSCMCYVDDRAIKFNGDWKKTINDIMTFKNYIEEGRAK